MTTESNAPASVQLIDPRKIKKNPDNPRLIFQPEELSALEESIKEQGILVPLTVYKDGRNYPLLDGERRWRCSIRLGLHRVPVIIQEKPDRVTNIMMMFAIHNARQDWDPLPTAIKLEELERIMTKAAGEPPSERRLAATASLSTGEVRRYRKILALSPGLRKELMKELRKPRNEQRLTVDQVIEAVDGVNRLSKAEVIGEGEKNQILHVVVKKFRAEVLKTVEPRKFSRIARAVERGEVKLAKVRAELDRFKKLKNYTINKVFENTVEQSDFAHGTEQLVRRSLTRLQEIRTRRIELTDDLRKVLHEIAKEIRSLLGS
jgi:ParB family transcriptional regulator, chromosome partitioning protein